MNNELWRVVVRYDDPRKAMYWGRPQNLNDAASSVRFINGYSDRQAYLVRA